jgi:hypothetical protein
MRPGGPRDQQVIEVGTRRAAWGAHRSSVNVSDSEIEPVTMISPRVSGPKSWLGIDGQHERAGRDRSAGVADVAAQRRSLVWVSSSSCACVDQWPVGGVSSEARRRRSRRWWPRRRARRAAAEPGDGLGHELGDDDVGLAPGSAARRAGVAAPRARSARAGGRGRGGAGAERAASSGCASRHAEVRRCRGERQCALSGGRPRAARGHGGGRVRRATGAGRPAAS